MYDDPVGSFTHASMIVRVYSGDVESLGALGLVLGEVYDGYREERCA
jgi:hypothetical protein